MAAGIADLQSVEPAELSVPPESLVLVALAVAEVAHWSQSGMRMSATMPAESHTPVSAEVSPPHYTCKQSAEPADSFAQHNRLLSERSKSPRVREHSFFS